MTVIKRYSNRKLYDTERSCYITLEEIAEMVRNGEEVRIVDNRTGEDLTTVTLAQIVFEEERRDKRGLNIPTLRTLIQSPTELLQRLTRPMSELREQTQSQVDRFKNRAVAQQEEMVAPLREFIEGLQRSVDEMQHRLDGRVRDALGSMTHASEMAAKIATLEDRVDHLEAEIRALKRNTSSANGAGHAHPAPAPAAKAKPRATR